MRLLITIYHKRVKYLEQCSLYSAEDCLGTGFTGHYTSRVTKENLVASDAYQVGAPRNKINDVYHRQI